MISGRSHASCGCCNCSCPALAFLEAMSVFFTPSLFWDIWYRLHSQNETWTAYTNDLLPNNYLSKQRCVQWPLPMRSQAEILFPEPGPTPKSLKSKIFAASLLIKVFHSVMFLLTVRADELLVLLMRLPGYSYRDCPDTNPSGAPGLSKGSFPVAGTCKTLRKKPLAITLGKSVPHIWILQFKLTSNSLHISTGNLIAIQLDMVYYIWPQEGHFLHQDIFLGFSGRDIILKLS